eukprot:s3587_g4.t1
MLDFRQGLAISGNVDENPLELKICKSISEKFCSRNMLLPSVHLLAMIHQQRHWLGFEKHPSFVSSQSLVLCQRANACWTAFG